MASRGALPRAPLPRRDTALGSLTGLTAGACARLWWGALCGLLLSVAVSSRAAPVVVLPKQALGPEDVAIIVNREDPVSVAVGRYYSRVRALPADHLIEVSFRPGASKMPASEFAPIYARVRAETPDAVQAYVLTWTQPYRVDCMSITTAFAVGFDRDYCASGCRPAKPSPYFASNSHRPFADYGIRPTMMIPGPTLDAARALIERGRSADDTRPTGTAYLVSTSDEARNVRAQGYAETMRELGGALRIESPSADFIQDRSDVLFYFTGLREVPRLATNAFRPGAIADHLTSTGGQLTDSRQMSILRWLAAGATGSYGAVTEPCNFPAKFPDVRTLIRAYVTGSTLLEAYWQSVLMPGQGVFVGEPLARPFGGYDVSKRGSNWTLSTYALKPGAYLLEGAGSPLGPYKPLMTFVKPSAQRLELPLPLPVLHSYRILADVAGGEGLDSTP
ncbi:TIGR03790 family protein [Thiorhodococcus minor]|uniref:TIGR03790 family protein n=1 Tax=Thiorhodococcus minor TaxID=57489 RepID=A0A6M0K0F0_9GAMM|nr:TIGR03790 family protein [Thiorhodococcus minor]NEV63220.1 TIGR03790 family protein [Thiorhodococcus minor]